MSQVLAFAVEVTIEFDAAVHRLVASMDDFRKDLRLFTALSVARFIVWRELRRRAKLSKR